MNAEGNQYDSIRFGPFELRVQSCELCREGVPIKLPPQPFKVLLLLVENAGRLVTRKELQEEVWGAGTYVDFDKGLNLCIAQIREALGDDAQSPVYIETLPRRGYRFIANVERRSSKIAPAATTESAHAEPTRGLSDPEHSIGRKSAGQLFSLRRSSVLIVSVAIISVAIVATIIYLRSHRDSGSVTKSMLLVLPFQNLTNDPTQDYFSDGLTEEMITRLGSLQPRRLGVIARTTALTYKNSGKDIRQIGHELGVNYVLEGSVRRESGRLRITSQLIQVDDQTHLWAESFDRDEKDVLDIQAEVATRVASSLSLELLPTSYSEVAAGKIAKPEAYDAYLKGRYLITKDSLPDLQRSIPYFDLAIEKDPGFAPAYVAEVEALVLIADWTDSAADASLPKAKAAALKAVELNPEYSGAYAALGSVQFWLEWNWRDAETNLRRAVELNPNNPLTRLQYGTCLLARGHAEAGANEINEAVKLDPVSLLTTGLAAFCQLHVGRYDEAIALSNRMLELEPKSPAAHECLFRAYLGKGDHREAVNITLKRMTMNGAKPKPEQLALLSRGNPKDVLEARFREELGWIKESASKGEKVWPLYAASLCVMLGDKDHALEWLEKAVSERLPSLVYLGVDPIWDPLRSDPRFHQLAQKGSL